MKKDILVSAQEKVAKALSDHGNVTVVFKPGACPQADVEKKIITLPLMPEDISDETLALLRGWIDHESGHMKYTEKIVLDSKPSKRDELIMNVVEDCRIEKLQTERGLGIYKNIRNGYDVSINALKAEQKNPDVPAWHKALKGLCHAWSPELYDRMHKIMSPEGLKYLDQIPDEINEILSGKIKTQQDAINMAKKIMKKWDIVDEEEEKQQDSEGEGQKGEGEESEDSQEGEGGEGEGNEGDKDSDGKDKKQKEKKKSKSKPDNKPQEQEQKKQKKRAQAQPSSMWDDLAKKIEGNIPSIGKPGEGPMPCIPWTENDAEIDMTNKEERDAVAYGMSDSQLLESYKKILERVRRMVNVIRRKLLNDLVSIGRVWTLNKTEGVLNDKALHKIGTGDRAVFKRRIKKERIDTAVSLVIDCSGSMNGEAGRDDNGDYVEKIDIAIDAAVLFAETLDLIKVPFETIGFTGDASSDAKKWKKVVGKGEMTYPREERDYSRLGAILHFIVKSFGAKNRNCKRAYAALKYVGHHNNIDGESILFAAKRLAQRPEGRKVMFVFSDGRPAGYTNYDQTEHLKAMVKKITKSGIELIGVGIADTAVKRYYPKCVVIKNLKKFTETTYKLLSEMLKKG